MNSTHSGRNRIGFKERLRKYRMGLRVRHDPWLVLNMASFNFEGGWNRTFNPLRASATGRC
jgi:hypothetical protein